MTKIRDLGINTIPATMRPPAIGGGAAYEACSPGTNQRPPDCLEASGGGPPRPGPGPGCENSKKNQPPKVNAQGYSFDDEAIALLRQRLHDALEIAN